MKRTDMMEEKDHGMIFDNIFQSVVGKSFTSALAFA